MQTQLQTVTPYLIIHSAQNFLHFMKVVFNATEKGIHKRENGVDIMHGEILVGNSSIMFAEATDQWKKEAAGLFIWVDNADESYAKAITAGATEVMPLSDQSYGRTCGVKDAFGNTWWITSAIK